MTLTAMAKKERPTLIIGKSGTGKTTLAKDLVRENPLILYANEIEDLDWKSIESDIIIEEVHFKPDKDIIMDIIRHCNTTIILTSNNKKNVPKIIMNCCNNMMAGTTNHAIERVKELAPRSQNPYNYEKSIFDIVMDYLKNPNREEVLQMLKFNKPADVQILTWLGLNMHPNKLVFVDGKVKRRWPSTYFYEMLAYNHDGRIYTKVKFPKRGNYSKVPTILRKLKIKPNQGYLLPQLLEDSDFEKWAKKRLKSEETRMIGIKDKTRPRNAPIIPDRTLKLERWF